ncbi:hypothetical protein [Streptomyces sp. SCL15-4]|uniref:hypothetical protein n=1 Tax=Streptomyces sp. SCL15-4 TaxID=2967221 RepID=UPI0029669B47|nr:hypothetical protein [Streptomyces sp. SCL15-4]
MQHRPAIFAALLGLTRAGSAIGDFWVQSDFCARVKGVSDGRKACLHHCLTYTATQAIVAGLGARALGVRVRPGAAAAALALSFGTHYIADRRVPGHGVLEKLASKTGKTNFYKLASHGMNGAFHLDNSWHHDWETVAALIATAKATTR